MAVTVADTLVTRYLAHTRDWEQGNARMDAWNDRAISKMGNVEQAAQRVGQAFGAISAAITGLVVMSFTKFAEFDAMTKSLQSIEGSAMKAAQAMKVLRDVAKLPGLGLEEAISGFSGLRMQGLNSAQSERILRATGNANALMGGGRDELARVLLAIQQILTRPNLSGEELNQLAEARIPARGALVKEFGTADTEELKRRGVTAAAALEVIIRSLEEMPKAADGPKNSLENLQVAFSQALVQVGEGLAVYILPHLQAFGAALDRLNEAGVFRVLGDSLATWVSSFEGLSNGVTTWEGAIISITAVIAGVIEAMGNLNRAFITILKNPLVQIAVAAMGSVSNIVGIVGGGLSGFFEASMNRAQQMSSMVRDYERYGGFTGGLSSFVGAGIDGNLANFKLGGDAAEAALAAQAEQEASRKAVNHLARIEANTREMIDVQRMILGGGQMARFGVTATELAGFRSGGGASSGEAQVIAGMRRMLFEMMSAAPRRGMG